MSSSPRAPFRLGSATGWLKRGVATNRSRAVGLLALCFVTSFMIVIIHKTPTTPSSRLLAAEREAVFAVAFAPDGQTLASAGGDAEWIPSGQLHLWQVATGQRLASLPGHRHVVRCVAFSPQGRTLASGSFDGTVKLWDLATGQEQASFPSHDGRVVAEIGRASCRERV